MRNLFLSKIRIILLFSLILFITLCFKNVFAEYYLVYGGSKTACTACKYVISYPVDERIKCYPIHKQVHKTYRHNYHAYHSQHKVRKPVECYSTAPKAPMCCIAPCRTCYKSYQAEFVDFSSRPNTYHSYYYPDDYFNYDPDLSTGDDDPIVYPGMDIDE